MLFGSGSEFVLDGLDLLHLAARLDGVAVVERDPLDGGWTAEISLGAVFHLGII